MLRKKEYNAKQNKRRANYDKRIKKLHSEQEIDYTKRAKALKDKELRQNKSLK